MFENTGKKIKDVATFFCLLGIVICVIAGIVLIASGARLNNSYYSSDPGTPFIIAGVLLLLIGPIISWLLALLFAGLGDLIISQQNTERLLEKAIGQGAIAAYDAGTGNNTKVTDHVVQKPEERKQPNKVTVNAAIPEFTQPTVLFGNYTQSNDSLEKSAIEWLVLAERDNLQLLISKYALDSKPFDSHSSNDWNNSDINRWLNEDFFNAAFDENDQKRINNGRVFFLSESETQAYFKSESSRICTPTEYAIKAGAWVDPEIRRNGLMAGWWWLSSSGKDSGSVVGIGSNGKKVNSPVWNATGCVRPAIWITKA